jgi:Leucine-rich repeat (LRR) protein
MTKKTIVLFAAALVAGIGVSCCKESPEIVVADPAFEAYCLSHFDKNGDGLIQKNEVKSVKSLDVRGLGICSLKGLEEFLSLEKLDCSRNQLARLYLSKNRELTTLYCAHNELPALDVSHNENLQVLDCSCNPITAIHVWPDFDAAACSGWNVPEQAVFQRP